MIAIAIGVPGGLEATVASSGKKDENPALFADTFQKASLNGADQAAKAVTKRTGMDRNAAQNKKTNATSSTVNTQKPIARTSGRTTATIQATGKDVSETVGEGAGEGTLAAAAKQSSVVAAQDDEQVETSEDSKSEVSSKSSLSGSAGLDKDQETVSVETKSRAASRPTELVAGAGGKQSTPEKYALKSENGMPVGQNDVSISSASASSARSTNLVLPDAPQEETSHLTHQVDDRAEIGTTLSTPRKAAQETAKSTGQTLIETVPNTPSETSRYSPSQDGFSEAAKVAEEVTPVFSIAPQVEVSVATTSFAAVPAPGASDAKSTLEKQAKPLSLSVGQEVLGSAQAAALVQAAPSRMGSLFKNAATGTETVKADEPPLSVKSSISAAQNISALPTSTVKTSPNSLETAPPKLKIDEAVCVDPQAHVDQVGEVAPQSASDRADLISPHVEGSGEITGRGASKQQPSKSVVKHEDLNEGKIAGTAEGDAAKSSLMANSVVASSVPDSQLVFGVATPVTSAVSPTFTETSGSAAISSVSTSVRTAGSYADPRSSFAKNQGVRPEDEPVSATPGRVGALSGDKAVPMNSVKDAFLGPPTSEASGGGGSVTTDGEAAAIQAIANSMPSIAPSGGTISQDTLVTIANSLAGTGKQRGTVSSNVPQSTKERKSSEAETKTVDVRASSGLETAHGVAIESSTSTTVQAKSIVDLHRTAAADGGQAASSPISVAEGMTVTTQSHTSVLAGSVDQALLHTGSELASVKTAGVSANEAGEGFHAGVPATNDVLSPLAHTTLAATPTVLEVGVPSGTQGWLKIRAEIGEGGVVQASMSSSTHAGQDALHRDLPAINAFLESERLQVSVQVAHGTSASAGSLPDGVGLSKDGGFNPGSGLGQSLNQDANSSAGSEQGGAPSGMLTGSGNGQNGGRQQESSQSAGSVLPSNSVADAVRAGRPAADSDWATSDGYGSRSAVNGGSWLNVMA